MLITCSSKIERPLILDSLALLRERVGMRGFLTSERKYPHPALSHDGKG
jgi:hypothetical protein